MSDGIRWFNGKMVLSLEQLDMKKNDPMRFKQMYTPHLLEEETRAKEKAERKSTQHSRRSEGTKPRRSSDPHVQGEKRTSVKAVVSPKVVNKQLSDEEKLQMLKRGKRVADPLVIANALAKMEREKKEAKTREGPTKKSLTMKRKTAQADGEEISFKSAPTKKPSAPLIRQSKPPERYESYTKSSYGGASSYTNTYADNDNYDDHYNDNSNDGGSEEDLGYAQLLNEEAESDRIGRREDEEELKKAKSSGKRYIDDEDDF
ncbi:hypothetical protein EIN_059340 [Entamoeba invadens IP1]|uniref:Uncharacterized protein n=1 Tax=Entamoeba invadens TaxID=33085 RepID=S0B4C0_ENTIV|nr:hypothetical protein EIN_059340 [Entamoeba invadens IP1]ELP93449.1 hypothetical protein EIN_059340 [Entamoeba invadens IP1]BAN42074.1 hypothetical protein [Entamoeba invadens]|eukprot:XP_004260220.1 hypothetical protein EIN_059340 [Entamoeba invadens IP1]